MIRNPFRFLLPMGAAVALLAPAMPVAAEHHDSGEHAAWEQARAQALSEQLNERLQRIYAIAESDKARANVGQAADAYVIVEDIKLLRRHMGRLQRDLAKGADREATTRLFDRILYTVRELQSARQNVDLLGSAEPDLQSAYDAMVELAVLYERTVPPRPANVAAPPPAAP